MWTSVIAVLGTLAGGLLTGGLQARISRGARREDRETARREAQLAAVTALVGALADHRRAMWVREDERLSGATGDRLAEARAASHATRAAITAPQTTVEILAPELADVAKAAARAAYALRNAPSRTELDELREAAMNASDRLVAAAAEHLTA